MHGLMKELSPYPAYKATGVPWLGDVPRHWAVRRLKHAVDINPEALSEDTDPEYPFDYMDINSVGTGYLVNLPVRQRFGSAPSRARRVVRTGDTAISTVRTYLKAAYHLQRDWPNLIASTGFAVLRPHAAILPALLGHIVQSHAFIGQVMSNSVGVAYPAISETKLSTLFLVLPLLPEQRSIARYLEYVDRRIRRYVRAKEKLIGLLEEEKQAVINQAVTRGLDPKVRLKPSGVEWLGDLPEHWSIKKSSQLFSIGSGTTPPTDASEHYGGDIPWITTSELRESVIKSTRKTVTSQALQRFSSLRVYPKGSTAVAMYGATIGRIGVLGVPATVNQACCVFSESSEIDTWFWFYWLQSRRPHLIALGYGGGQPNLSQQLLKRIRVPVPPRNEQGEIIQYLDRSTSDTSGAIIRARRQIELIEEYRTRLIADVVTGKLDVREAAAALTDLDGRGLTRFDQLHDFGHGP